MVEAPPKELELLNCLASHPNRVYTRDQLQMCIRDRFYFCCLRFAIAGPAGGEEFVLHCAGSIVYYSCW